MALRQPCIPRQAFLNKIRELGYSFDIQSPRIDQYRRPTPLHHIHVPRKDLIPIEHVRSALRQAGRNEEEIERFISQTQTSTTTARGKKKGK